MKLPDIFSLALVLIIIRLLPAKRCRRYLMLVGSALCIFLFQPVLPVRELDFNFPLWTFLLVLCVYGSFSKQNPLKSKHNLIDVSVITGTVLLISATRFFSYDGILSASRPPQLQKILPMILFGIGLAFLLNYFAGKGQRWQLRFFLILIIVILAVLKTSPLAENASRIIRSLNGQDADLALSSDIRWFGFSYIAFRLLSILIDSLKGRKADLGLGDFFIYVCFPPSLSAGPIDRWDRFTKELKNGPETGISEDFLSAFKLIALGLFHKFILADSLAKMALSEQNAHQFVHSGWAWAALFAYGLQIYFDFSGYSEIAIGLGVLLGIHLPKNFDHPYLKPDLTKFWSSWHMTLTQWIRSYVFNPLTRSLRGKKEHPLPQWLIALIAQLTTMLLIGLWHGVTVNFIIWGLWHGLGLFFHQMYSRKTAPWLRSKSISFQRAYTVASTVLTILFVCLGWVWFVVPDFSGAVSFFGRLFS